MKQTMLAQPTVTGGVRPVVELPNGTQRLPRGSPTDCKMQNAKCKLQNGSDWPPGKDLTLPDDMVSGWLPWYDPVMPDDTAGDWRPWYDPVLPYEVSRGSPNEGKMQNAKCKVQTAGFEYRAPGFEPPAVNIDLPFLRAETRDGPCLEENEQRTIGTNDVLRPPSPVLRLPSPVPRPPSPVNDGLSHECPVCAGNPRLRYLYTVIKPPGLHPCPAMIAFENHTGALETWSTGAGMAERCPDDPPERSRKMMRVEARDGPLMEESAECKMQNAECKMQNGGGWPPGDAPAMFRAETRDGPWLEESAKCKAQNAKCKMQNATCLLPTENCELLPAGYELQTANCGLQTVFRSRNGPMETCPRGAGMAEPCPDDRPECSRSMLRAEARAGPCAQESVKCKMQSAKCKMQNANCELLPAGYELQTANCGLQTVFRSRNGSMETCPRGAGMAELCLDELRITNYELRSQISDIGSQISDLPLHPGDGRMMLRIEARDGPCENIRLLHLGKMRDKLSKTSRQTLRVETRDGPGHEEFEQRTISRATCVQTAGTPELCPEKFNIRYSIFDIRHSKTDPGIPGRKSKIVHRTSKINQPPELHASLRMTLFRRRNNHPETCPKGAGMAEPCLKEIKNAKVKMQKSKCKN